MAKIVDWNRKVVFDNPVESQKEPTKLAVVSINLYLESWRLILTAGAVVKTVEVGKYVSNYTQIDWAGVADEISKTLGYNNWELVFSE